MIAFIGFLCVLLAYYIERQLRDPGVKVFPFNGQETYSTEMPGQEGAADTAAQ